MIRVLTPFAPLFSKRVFGHAQLLLVGAILASGRRTVSSALRAMGLDKHEQFHRYHRVLSRARWSSLEASRILLGLLLDTFAGEGRLIVGIDETLERRYGKRISARGVYRDPVRSTHENFVKSSGLRWVCVMLLVEVPWAWRVWALPFLSALAPSERYAANRGRRHKKITEWAWQLLLLLRLANWYGSGERMVEVSSKTAVWYSTGLFAVPVRWVLIRDPEGKFKTQALLCTDLEVDPEKILSWYVMRWQLEVTFQEVRKHLGFETQRQWSDMAIRRTTPALMGLFSLIALFAHQWMRQAAGAFRRQAAWYHKRHPTFADALALVRKELWAHATFYGSPAEADTIKVPRDFMERLTEAVCYAA